MCKDTPPSTGQKKSICRRKTSFHNKIFYEWHGFCELFSKKGNNMKRTICILFTIITLSVVSFAENCDIYRAGSGEWLYTIDGNDIYRAGSGEWLYTILR